MIYFQVTMVVVVVMVQGTRYKEIGVYEYEIVTALQETKLLIMRENIMDISIWKFFFMVLLLMYLTITNASEKILVERYENWNHPMLHIFKKYELSLYKVSYSKNGKCPTFYAKFKYSPDPRGPASNVFEKMYFEILKANSNFPYALVDIEDDIRINVGWDYKEKTKMVIDLGKASSPTTCKDGSVNDEDSSFIVSTQMKKLIMDSPFKQTLHRGDGKKIIAYLYAEDEKNEWIERYACTSGEKKKFLIKTGHYYIYLYDVDVDSFLSSRIEVFKNFYKIIMNTDGTDFFVMNDANKNNSDILLISQFSSCNGNFYEAYGFYNGDPDLKKYMFVGKDKVSQLYGIISKLTNHGSDWVNSTIFDHKTHQFKLFLSNNSGEIQLMPLH